MDFQKISSLQSKFDRLKDGLEENGDDISNMEKKLLVSYLDEIKAVILEVPMTEEALPAFAPVIVPPSAPAPPPTRPRPIAVPKPAPVVAEKVAITPEKPKKKIEPEPKKGAISDELMEMFDETTPTELSDKIALIRIADLNKSMSINERIFTQKELFSNDQAQFQKVLSDLNKLDSFSSAKKYLINNVIDKYDWSNPSKVKKVSNFIKLVRRRFL